jgi:hypothetical protein
MTAQMRVGDMTDREVRELAQPTVTSRELPG